MANISEVPHQFKVVPRFAVLIFKVSANQFIYHIRLPCGKVYFHFFNYVQLAFIKNSAIFGDD